MSSRAVSITGILIQAAGILSSSFISNAPGLIFSQGLLFGCGNALSFATGLLFIAEYFVRRRHLATIMGSCGASIGGIVMPNVIRYLLDTYGLHGALWITSCLILNSLLFLILFTPPSDYHSHKRQPKINIDTEILTQINDKPQTQTKPQTFDIQTVTETQTKIQTFNSILDIKQRLEKETIVTKNKNERTEIPIDLLLRNKENINGKAGEIIAKRTSTTDQLLRPKSLLMSDVTEFAADENDAMLISCSPIASDDNDINTASKLLDLSDDDAFDAPSKACSKNSKSLSGTRTLHQIVQEIPKPNCGNMKATDNEALSIIEHNRKLSKESADKELSEEYVNEVQNINEMYSAQDVDEKYIDQNGHEANSVQKIDEAHSLIQNIDQSHLAREVKDMSGIPNGAEKLSEEEITGALLKEFDEALVVEKPLISHQNDGCSHTSMDVHKREPRPHNQADKSRFQIRLPEVFRMSVFWLLTPFFVSMVMGPVSRTFLPPFLNERGISTSSAALLMSLASACDLGGRLISAGCVESLSPCPRCIVYCLTPLFHHLAFYVLLSAVYGSQGLSLLSFQSLLVIEHVGMKHVQSAFGFYHSVAGISAGIAYTLCGYLKDLTGGFSIPYVFMGGCYLFGIIPLIHRVYTNRNKSRLVGLSSSKP